MTCHPLCHPSHVFTWQLKTVERGWNLYPLSLCDQSEFYCKPVGFPACLRRVFKGWSLSIGIFLLFLKTILSKNIIQLLKCSTNQTCKKPKKLKKRWVEKLKDLIVYHQEIKLSFVGPWELRTSQKGCCVIFGFKFYLTLNDIMSCLHLD